MLEVGLKDGHFGWGLLLVRTVREPQPGCGPRQSTEAAGSWVEKGNGGLRERADWVGEEEERRRRFGVIVRMRQSCTVVIRLNRRRYKR